MHRLILATVMLVLSGFGPALAQSDAEVVAARELFIAGSNRSALLVLVPAAEAGNAMAQNTVGTAYLEGLGGLPVDVNLGLDYYQRSAAQDYGPAFSNLGALYLYGVSELKPDLTLARAYYEKAVDRGEVGSIAFLGAMWLDGRGGPASIPRAMALMQFGDAQGDAKSSYNLGHVYYEGLYVAQDLPQAQAYFARAAARGLVEGMLGYGLMLEYGDGGPVDLDAAMRQYRAAIARGNLAAAMQASGIILEDYNGYPDFVEALVLCWWARDRATGAMAADYARRCEQTETHYNFLGVRAAEQRLLEMQQAESD